MDNGWVKLYRKIKDSSIFQDEYTLQLWIYILVSVNHKKKKFLFNNEEMVINPGSGIFGMNQIVSDLKNLNNPNKPKFKKFKTIYYRKLKLLEKLGKVKLQPTNKFTVITVVRWDDHQQIETQVKLKRNSSETQVKTNKNVNNENKKELFEQFWNLYNKKIDHKKCLSRFLKLKQKDIDIIFKTLPDYIKSTPDAQYRKSPSTYLNNDSWLNEIIKPKNNHTGFKEKDYGESTPKEEISWLKDK